MSSFVLVCCQNRRQITRLVRFVIIINFSRKVLPLASNCNCTVAKSACNCPLATITWNLGRGLSFSNVCGASNRSLCKLASGMAHEKKMSMKPSLFNSLISLEIYSVLRSFSNAKLIDTGKNLVIPPLVTRSCGEIYSSITATCLWRFRGLED